jgi:hypothetical protein
MVGDRQIWFALRYVVPSDTLAVDCGVWPYMTMTGIVSFVDIDVLAHIGYNL